MTQPRRGRAALAALPAPGPDDEPARQTSNDAFVGDHAEPIRVPFRSCTCPGKPHGEYDVATGEGGDTIFLRPDLDLEGGFTFTSAFAELSASESDMPAQQVLGMAYLIAGISDWTFKDDKGHPIPASRPNIARLRWTPAVAEVADVAARRYGPSALLPLVDRMQRLSQLTQTTQSTSRSSRSSTKRPGRSSRSTT